MKVRIKKTDEHLGIKSGEIYSAKSYSLDSSKVTLLERISDGYEPMCNQYLHEVELIDDNNDVEKSNKDDEYKTLSWRDLRKLIDEMPEENLDETVTASDSGSQVFGKELKYHLGHPYIVGF